MLCCIANCMIDDMVYMHTVEFSYSISLFPFEKNWYETSLFVLFHWLDYSHSALILLFYFVSFFCKKWLLRVWLLSSFSIENRKQASLSQEFLLHIWGAKVISSREWMKSFFFTFLSLCTLYTNATSVPVFPHNTDSLNSTYKKWDETRTN